MERFLYRLSKSPYVDNFVLKGALMLTVWEAPLSRPTMDIDLLGLIDNSIEDIVAVTKNICTQEVEPDGITFDPTYDRFATQFATSSCCHFPDTRTPGM
jgi:hypothetical protein